MSTKSPRVRVRTLDFRKIMTGKVCLCGKPAFCWHNGYVCRRCRSIEARMFTPRTAGNGSDYGDAAYAVSGDINNCNR